MSRRGQTGGRWRGRGRDRSRSYGNMRNKKMQHPSSFVGATSKMPGHVFQVNGEQRKRGQFKDTLGILKIYASENFPKDVRKMKSVSGDVIQKPEIMELEEPTINAKKNN